MEKKGKFLKFLVAFIIAVLFFSNLIFISYFKFQLNQVYGIDEGIFSNFKSYSAYLLSKIPLVNKFVKYEPLSINEPKKYFEEVLESYKKNIEELIKQSEEKLKEAEKLKQENELLYKTLKSIEDEWKERKIKEEISKVEVVKKVENLDSLVEIFKNGDSKELLPLMNSEKVDVKTLAVVFQKLSPDLRSEMVQSLASVNPTKAASVVNTIYNVEEILKEVNSKIKELEDFYAKLYERESQLISLEGFNKAIKSYILSLTEEEIKAFINQYQESPKIVAYILSNIEPSKSRNILKWLKENNEKLFIEIIKIGGGIEWTFWRRLLI